MLLIGKSHKFIKSILEFGLSFVIVTNVTNYNGSRSKIALWSNNYYFKVVFIFSTILLLSLVTLTNHVHAANISIFKSPESSKKNSILVLRSAVI